MVDPEKVTRLAEVVAKKIRGGMDFTQATREALRGQGVGEDYPDYFPAIGAEFNTRSQVAEGRRAPEAPHPILEKPAANQPGFGFGEGPRAKKNRPPTRRML